MSRGGSANRAAVRWRRREAHAAWEKALREAGENRLPAYEDFEALPPAAPPQQGTRVPRTYRTKDEWRREGQTICLSDSEIDTSWAWYDRHAGQRVLEPVPENVWRVLTRNNRVEDDWRRDARAGGLSKQEVEDSWAWYSCFASGGPPVLDEEATRALPENMPESVRRVLTHNIRYAYLADDPFVDDLLSAFKQPIPIPDDLQRVSEDWQFWDDIGRALAPSDPPDADDRRALDRLARLVKLKPEYTRQVAKQKSASMAATKRHLIHLAVVLSVAAANAPIRIGRRTGKVEEGHAIRLQDVFGEDGLKEILSDLLRNTLGSRDAQSPGEIREELERSLGGPFRPARLTDPTIYRNWLIKEIRLQADKALGQDLDINDAGRLGGSRRQFASYEETDGQREDLDESRPRARNYTEPLAPWDVTERTGEEEEARVAFARMADQVWRQHEAPVLREYIACVQKDPGLLDDDAEAAKRLGWPEEWKVRDTKRRFKRHLAQLYVRHAYEDWYAAYLADTRRRGGA
jgi:hypothetical protein